MVKALETWTTPLILFLGLTTFAPHAEASGFYNLGAFWRAPGCPGANFIQIASSADLTTSTATATLTPTTGHLLVAVATAGPHAPGTAAVFQMSDSLGNTWNATPPEYTTSGHLGQIWYASNVTGGSSDAVTATANYIPGYAFSQQLVVLEYGGMALTNILDVTAGAFGTTNTTTLSTGAMTITGGCDLVVAAFSAIGEQPSPSGGITNRFSANNNSVADDALVGATSGQSVNLSASLPAQSNSWLATETAFVTQRASFTAPSAPTQLAFSTSAQSLSTWTCSSAITAQLQNASSVPTNTMSDVTLSLAGTNVQFYYDPQCLLPVTSTTIWAGTNSQSFYAIFSDTTSGLITVTPSGAYSAITQTETLSQNSFIWTGGASCNGTWSTGACWSGGTAPSSSQAAHFDNHCSTNCNATLGANTSIGGLWLHSNTSSTVNIGSYTLTLSNKLPTYYGSLMLDAGTLNGNTGTVSTSSAVLVDGGTWNANSSTINFNNGNYVVVTNPSYFNAGTSTVNLSGPVQEQMTFYNLTLTGTSSYVTSQTINNNLVINSGDTFNPAGNLVGSPTITIGGNFTNNGTYNQGTTAGSSTTFASGSSHTIGGTTVPIFRNLNIQGPTTMNVGINVGASVIITSSLSSNGYPITVANSWTNNGTYTASGSEVVTFTSQTTHAINGTSATTFGGLALNNSGTAATLTFPAGVTTTVASSLSLSGVSGGILYLVSSSPGTAWNLVPPAATTLGGYLNVKDSDSSVTIHSGANSTNSGNNTNWQFP